MGSGIGTIAYAAPEFLDMRASGCAMDMWALGVVLYIVLCGSHPFDPTNDATDEELRHRIVRGQVRLEGTLVCVEETTDAVYRYSLIRNRQHGSIYQPKLRI